MDCLEACCVKKKENNKVNERVLSVTELNLYIKRMLDNDLMLSGVFIKGEISNFKYHTSGHMYMTLKDEQSVVRAVMFKSSAMRLKFVPEEGMKVIVFGRISVFESAGQYQVYIEQMQPDGVGALYVAFEQLKQKLEQEGLFSDEHKKKLPKFPEKIAVVTSPTGAAIRDILNVLGRRYDFANVVICPVLVQGDGAKEQIANAINYVNENNLAEVLIVGRGGGSIEDLWAFNEEIVARAIFNSKIPVISAVGHETDFTIADFVADLRAPTPSAAAELAVPSKTELLMNINSLKSRVDFALNSKLNMERQRLKSLSSMMSTETLIRSYDQKRLILDNKLKNILHISEKVLSSWKERFSKNVAALHSLSPLAVLGRGFTVTTSKDGNTIKSISDINICDEIVTFFSDGKVYSTVSKKKGNNQNG